MSDAHIHTVWINREYSKTLSRPFTVRYEPYTQTISVLDKTDKIVRYAASIKSDMEILIDALTNL